MDSNAIEDEDDIQIRLLTLHFLHPVDQVVRIRELCQFCWDVYSNGRSADDKTKQS